MAVAISTAVGRSVASAHRLACVFHRNETIAAKVAENALARFESATIAQRKRLYYAPARQCKTYFPPPALLHMLVLAESQPFECAEELMGDVAPAVMAARYVKHLIFIAARRNSFHVSLAIARLLFAYTTTEAMRLYDALLDPDDFVKEDYYYRARKRLLMRELEQRFPGLHRVNARRSEECFAPAADQRAQWPLVLATLDACTPWGTECGGPAGELQRLHELVHPPCLLALTARVGLDAPSSRLAIPKVATPGFSENATVVAESIATMGGF